MLRPDDNRQFHAGSFGPPLGWNLNTTLLINSMAIPGIVIRRTADTLAAHFIHHETKNDQSHPQRPIFTHNDPQLSMENPLAKGVFIRKLFTTHSKCELSAPPPLHYAAPSANRRFSLSSPARTHRPRTNSPARHLAVAGFGTKNQNNHPSSVHRLTLSAPARRCDGHEQFTSDSGTFARPKPRD